jgi:hypothetical protein
MVREFRTHGLIPNAVSLTTCGGELEVLHADAPSGTGPSNPNRHTGRPHWHDFPPLPNHRGASLLAHLQLGRAYALQGDTAKTNAAYQDFLPLWKDADSDVIILKAAKAEYAKLK